MVTAEQILNRFAEFDLRLWEAINNIFGGDREQILLFLQSEQYEQLLTQLGIDGLISDYVNGLDTITFDKLSGFSQVDFTAREIQRVQVAMELVKNTNERALVGYFTANTELVRSELIKSTVSGQTASETIRVLQAKYIRESDKTPHIITDGNIGTLVNTSYADQARLTTISAFEDRPEQRFRYEEDLLPTSSDTCRWLVENQDPEGYTMDEIKAGIETPFGTINESGRIPNYNCIHEWYPIYEDDEDDF